MEFEDDGGRAVMFEVSEEFVEEQEQSETEEVDEKEKGKALDEKHELPFRELELSGAMK